MSDAFERERKGEKGKGTEAYTISSKCLVLRLEFSAVLVFPCMGSEEEEERGRRSASFE